MALNKSVSKLIAEEFSGNRHLAAKACGSSIYFINNLVSEKRDVIALKNGDYLLLKKKCKMFDMEKALQHPEIQSLSVKDLVEQAFAGKRSKAASAAKVTEAFLNNWISKGCTVILLASGNYVIETKNQKIFNLNSGAPVETHHGSQKAALLEEKLSKIASIIDDLKALETPGSDQRKTIVGSGERLIENGVDVTDSVLVGHYMGCVRTISEILNGENHDKNS